jgi:hypothetical protein
MSTKLLRVVEGVRRGQKTSNTPNYLISPPSLAKSSYQTSNVEIHTYIQYSFQTNPHRSKFTHAQRSPVKKEPSKRHPQTLTVHRSPQSPLQYGSM